jgi:hypothetical protein
MDVYAPLWDNLEERRNTGAVVVPGALSVSGARNGGTRLSKECLREESDWFKWSFVESEEEMEQFRSNIPQINFWHTSECI